jgi:light-harvesting protein B-800-850 alpha chain
MNQGRIWCVVHPTVGLPLFLGSVAVMSFTVHFAVLNNTTWFGDYWNGSPMKRASVEAVATPVATVASPDKPSVAVEGVQASALTGDVATPVVVKVKPKARTFEPAASSPG